MYEKVYNKCEHKMYDDNSIKDGKGEKEIWKVTLFQQCKKCYNITWRETEVSTIKLQLKSESKEI